VNALGGETSAYLLQHADNPVDWLPWGEEAFARARREDRPVLLSVGYSSCHWCHVMAHESFEDPAVADVMNRHFVNVKVDREERPDVDAAYMDAVVALTGHGGWPMTVFLTPEGEPFWGGTYFPPQPRLGMPSFPQVLEAVAQTYRERRADVQQQAEAMAEAIRRSAQLAPAAGDGPGPDLLRDAVSGLSRLFDRRFGGFGGAPKFPPASVVDLLLRLDDAAAREMATATLEGMAQGGMYDLLGGGFARYSVDDRWLVPHFEKMLYDNALLASAYLRGWAATGDARWRAVAEETLDYLLREMRLPEGGFASSQDADTEGEEGLTYVWTPDEIRAALPGDDADAAMAYYGVTEEGNFEGRNVLRRSGPEPEGLGRIRAALLAARARRPQPGRDDKAVAAWNGLALSAFAEAGARLGRDDYVDAARACATFLVERMVDGDGRVRRSYAAGRAHVDGFLEDYAAIALGLLDAAVATGDVRFAGHARRLAETAVDLFADPDGDGFFSTPVDGEAPIARRKPLDDNPTPSGNSLMATLLVRLARLTGDASLEDRAAGILRLGADLARRAPHGFGQLLCALDAHLAPPREIAVVGPPADEATHALRRAVLAPWLPAAVYAFGEGTPAEGEVVPLLAGRTPVDGRPAVYVCERFACRRPVTDPDEAGALLAT
jgi:uncharacterized protein YyaL (SSP411 family)